MKAILKFTGLVCAVCLPLVGAEALTLEWIGPQRPVAIAQKSLDLAAKHGEASAAMQAEMKEAKPNPQNLMRLEELVMEGRSLEQKVGLKYRIRNTGDKPVTFRHGGDASGRTLSLSGPGAVHDPYQGMMTADFRIGREITLEAGGSMEFALDLLKHGKRDMDRWLITKAGDYRIGLTLKLDLGNQSLELKAAPLKLQVVAK